MPYLDPFRSIENLIAEVEVHSDHGLEEYLRALLSGIQVHRDDE